MKWHILIQTYRTKKESFIPLRYINEIEWTETSISQKQEMCHVWIKYEDQSINT